MTLQELETLHLSLATVAGFLALVAGVVGPWLIAGCWVLRHKKLVRAAGIWPAVNRISRPKPGA